MDRGRRARGAGQHALFRCVARRLPAGAPLRARQGRRAAAALTEVPLNETLPSVAPILAEMMSTPGAVMSTHGPKLEKVASVSLMFEAATVIAADAEAGDVKQASACSLPAATTTVTPASCTACTALFTASEKPPPRDMTTTLLVAVSLAAYSRPRMMSE